MIHALRRRIDTKIMKVGAHAGSAGILPAMSGQRESSETLSLNVEG